MISLLSSTRSSLICVAIGMSPTSSRNSVPPLAYSNLPMRSVEASVNAPRTWPNSSLSRMFSLKRGAVQRHERLVLARAVLMDRLGDQFLAGAGFALDQHAGVGRARSASAGRSRRASAGCCRSRLRSRTSRRAAGSARRSAAAAADWRDAFSATARSWFRSSGLSR